MAYTRVWDENAPVGSTTPAKDIDDLFRQLKVDIRERLEEMFGIADFTADPVVLGNVIFKLMGVEAIAILNTAKQRFYDAGNGGAALAIDWAEANHQKVTLNAADCTISFTGDTDVGEYLVLWVAQDATGGRTITWPAEVNWGDSGQPLLSPTASKIDVVMFFRYSSTRYHGFTVETGLSA